MATARANLISVNFEVFGKVQGCSFRVEDSLLPSPNLPQDDGEWEWAGLNPGPSIYPNDSPASKPHIQAAIHCLSFSTEKKSLSIAFGIPYIIGVFFRKHTQKEATKLGLTGWVQNTPAGTVVGVIEGTEDKVKLMKKWLAETGSPKSVIKKCVCNDEKMIEAKIYPSFSVNRD